MPVSESEINKVGYFGYSPICETVCNSTYALFVIDDSGDIIGGYGGSAFAVSSDGLFITATHVLGDLKDRLNRSDRQMALTRDTSPFEAQKEIYTDIDTHGNFPAYEVDTLFHPGFSGGPLISLRKGDVIGVVHSRGRYLDEFNSRKFPAPSHLSQANVITNEHSRSISIGSKLVDLGVACQNGC